MPSLIATLGLNASAFQQGLNAAKGTAAKAGSQIGSTLSSGIAGGLAALSGVGMVSAAFREISRQAEEARSAINGGAKLGITGEQFLNYSAAAEKYGASIGDVGAAFKHIATESIQALDGNAEAIASFRNLGVSLEDLKRKSVSELFDQIGNSLRGSEVSAARMAAMIKTMGKSATELIPAFQSGEMGKADPFGKDQSTLEASAQFGKDIGVFKKVWRKTWEEVFSPDANKDGVLSKTIHWAADKVRKQFGIREGAKAPPLDLKTVSKAEIETEQGKKVKQAKDLEEVKRLENELFDLQRKHAFDRMSDEEKILELKRRETEIQKFVNSNPTTDAGRLQAGIDIENLRAQRSELEGKLDKPTSRPSAYSLNELQKIGAYSAAPPESKAQNDTAEAARETVQQLAAIKDILMRQRTSGVEY